MPKKAFDYNKTEIYKIIHCDPDKDFCYVGHTTNFTERKKSHKRAYTYESETYHHLKVYQMIRENGGWDNFKMVFIEKWSCENLREAQAREQHWIDTLKPNMNDSMAQRSSKQYYQDTKEQRKKLNLEWKKVHPDYNKNYRDANKEKLAILRHRRFECECGSTFSWAYKTKHLRTQKHIQWCNTSHEI